MASSSDEPTKTSENLNQLPEENLRLLLDTIEGINQTTEFKSVLTESMEAARLLMNSEASSLMILDKDSGDLYISMPTGPVKTEIVGKSVPRNRGISGWVAENKRPYLTNDVEQSEHFYRDLVEGFKTKTMICVPLINRKNEVIGVMQAINRRGNADFTPHDIPVFQALASHITIAIERTRQIDILHSRLQEKDALIIELHHRIKNNLQSILALIDNEIDEIEDEHARRVLRQTVMRIQSMSKLHDMLSEKNLENRVEMGRYLHQLSDRIQETMSSLLYDVKISLDCEEVHLAQDRALLCGLILNELMINIYKHAFRKEEDDGAIEIGLSTKDGLIELRVSDNGVGLPEDFKIAKKYSIGMWIVDELLKKLKADLHVSRESGTRFVFTFPVS